MKNTKALYITILMIYIFTCAIGQSVSNLLPMYGEVSKSDEHIKIDEQFINEIIASKGSREKGAEQLKQRGWAYFYHDSLDLSMKRFNQVWLLTPDDPDVYFGFAALTELKGNGTDAARYYKMGITKDINHDRAKICYQKIADCKEHLKDYKGTINAYENIASIDPKNAFAYKKLGYFNSELGNLDAALTNYNKAIELDPTDAVTFNNRGYLYRERNDRTKAITDYNKAIQLDPTYTNAYVFRGATKLEIADIEGAKKDFEKSVELDPNTGELWRELGNCKFLLKDLNGACNDFEIAAKLGDAQAKELMQKVCSQKQ